MEEVEKGEDDHDAQKGGLRGAASLMERKCFECRNQFFIGICYRYLRIDFK